MNKKRGEIMLIVVILFMVVSLIVMFGVVNPTLRNIKVPSDLLKSKQSLFLSDSGVADAVYRLKNNLQISGEEFLVLNGSFATTTIVDVADGKVVTGVGDYLNYNRNVEARVTKGSGVSFPFAVQVGQGGFTMSNAAKVYGNIYSNSTVTGGNVTGSAISAGASGKIDRTNIGENGVGDAHAHTVINSEVEGALKCKVGSSNNKPCDTNPNDPELADMPISAEQIDEWKTEAAAGQVISGNLTVNNPISMGPVKITGNLTVKNKITMTGTIWIGGTLSFSGAKAQIVLATSTYSGNSGVIIVNKYTTFSGGSQIQSTGQAGSYVMLLVTSDCPISTFCSGKDAISASGNAGSVLLVAPYGTIKLNSNVSAKEVVANKVIMNGNSKVNYDTGLLDLNFVSGPLNGYYVSDFKETE